jgi:preprotein translocase subunit Sec61beta
MKKREKKSEGKNTGSSAGIIFFGENENFQKYFLLLLLLF